MAFSFLLVTASAPASSHFQGTPNNPNTPPIIRSQVDLVVLPVTVTDRKGHPVLGLTEGDFRVFENGQLQSITRFSHTDVPVTTGLVVDSSGSMGPNRPEVAEAAKDLLIASNPQDEFFVVNFNENVSLGLQPGIPFTDNVAELETAVLKGPSTGLTALYDAVALALKHVASGTNEKKALIVISDGGDNASHESSRELLSAAAHSKIIIYAIGILNEGEADVNPGVLRRLAKSTGGRSYFPQSAEDLAAICKQIARDLREQYTIAYIPSDKLQDGTYRAIHVSVHAPGRGSLVVRTRAGYFAPSISTADAVPEPGR